MGRYLNGKRLQNELFARTEGYANEVRKIYNNALSEIIELVKGTELEDGKPFSFADYGYSDVVTPILRNMYSRTYQTIKKGVTGEWKHSNEQCDELVKSIFGAKSIEDNHFARYFQRNQDAMDAFLERKTGKEGLNLSQKVWKYTGAYKEELEDTIELALGEGKGANRLAPTIKKYLQEPDRWYKRFRVKIGEDENGNPIYGRKWKRRIWDKDSDSYKWIDSEPKNYHPGKGVYRSSARNAQRLARTETNIAYREADHERWEQLDFVVGIEIKLSNNHPDPDICNDLAGVYPKDFKWNGWHPNCRCYAEPKLAKQEEMDKMLEAILEGQDPGTVEVEREKEMPDNFTTWIKANKDRYEGAKQAGTLSYFLKDNQTTIEKVLYGLTPEEKKAQSFGDILVNPLETLSKYGMKNLESLYTAVQSKLDHFSTYTLDSQKTSLEYEIGYVNKYKKYSTWKEAADAYQKALDKVNFQIEKREIEGLLIPIESFLSEHPKSKKVKLLHNQIQVALNANDLPTAKNLIVQAQAAIGDYNVQAAKKAVKANKIEDIEKYNDANRHYDFSVTDEQSFRTFEDKRIQDMLPAWKSGSVEAKKAIFQYTGKDYEWINESYYKAHTGCDVGRKIDTILDKCFLSEDVVLRRGTDFNEMGAIFGEDFNKLLRSGDFEGLNQFNGIKGVNEAFISTAFNAEGGFHYKDVNLQIFAPKGTQAIYAKPISVFGDNLGKRFDGTNQSKRFYSSSENEVIIHRGYEYKFIKAETGGIKGAKVTIYIELLTRNKRLVK